MGGGERDAGGRRGVVEGGGEKTCKNGREIRGERGRDRAPSQLVKEAMAKQQRY